jgi:hypothetical protein
MAKDPAERYPRAHELLRAATEAFDRRSRAVLRTPAPIESPEQLGVRAPETTVPTEERPREPGATVGATVPGGSPREKLRPRPALIAATVAALVLLAGIGFLAAKPGKSTSRSASIAASAGSLSVAIPSEWRPLAQRLSAPGITVRDPLAVGPPGVASGGLVVGQAPASGAALVPTRFLKSSGNPKPALVRIGRLEGYRYGPVTPAGFHREVAVYAVPTSRGVATSQCYATAPGQAFLAACERVVSTLRLDGGRAYPVRPSAEYAHSLDTALAPVRTARATAPSLLRHAKTLPAQGAVAARIGAAYARAGTQVRLVDGGPRVSGAQARLASALERVGRAYANSAAAARRHSASGYRTAARAVTSAGREVAAAAKAFGPLGYVIPV